MVYSFRGFNYSGDFLEVNRVFLREYQNQFSKSFHHTLIYFHRKGRQETHPFRVGRNAAIIGKKYSKYV
jgi:hypothetical protein